jgi:hypothetical protein
VRINRLYSVIFITLMLVAVSRTGHTMEPGHPELAGYKFLNKKLYLTKIWITSDEQKPVIVSAEFVLKSSKLKKILTSKNFERPEMLGDNYTEADGVLYLSHLPVKGWNHGKDVDALLLEVKKKRPMDIKQQLLHWVLSKVARDQFRKPLPADNLSSSLSYEFPISDQFKMDAVLLKVDWRGFDARRTIESKLYIMDVKPRSVGSPAHGK